MDYSQNREWLHNLCCSTTTTTADSSSSSNTTYRHYQNETMIIIAGDISHNLDILQWTFNTLQTKFAEVVYTPGNHELWLDKPRKHTHHHQLVATKLDDADDDDDYINIRVQSSGNGDGCSNSIEKLESVLQLCKDSNVHIGPVRVGGINSSSDDDDDNISNSRRSSDRGTNQQQQQPLWVIPILSWHHDSFDTEPSIENWKGIPSARKGKDMM